MVGGGEVRTATSPDASSWTEEQGPPAKQLAVCDASIKHALPHRPAPLAASIHEPIREQPDRRVGVCFRQPDGRVCPYQTAFTQEALDWRHIFGRGGPRIFPRDIEVVEIPRPVTFR